MRGSGGRVVRNAAVGAPGAAATGAARALVSNGVNPGLAGVPVNKYAWVFDGAAIVLGLTGAVIGAATGEEDWYEATEGVLQTGLAYAAEDGTHEINRLIRKPKPGTAAPGTVLRVVSGGPAPGVRVNRAAAGGGARMGGGGLFGGV